MHRSPRARVSPSLESSWAEDPEVIRQELSQAKARLGVCLFALAYVAGWTWFSGPVNPVVVPALLSYTAFSIGCILWIRGRPIETPWRRYLVIVGDLGINTFFLHVMGERGAFFYPMYLWIIVGNGMRFGARSLLIAMGIGVVFFASTLTTDPYWQTNPVAGSGLLAGLVVLPLFYLSLIRKLHASNAALAEKVLAAEAASRAKDQILANMSHELRTPMSGVIGVTDLLRSTPLEPRQREYLDLVHRSAQALLRILDDLLTLSRLEGDVLQLRPERLDPAALAGDVVHLLMPEARSQGLELQLRLPADLPAAVLGDPVRIRQILFNLLGNALKFTEQGQIVLSATWQNLDGNRLELRFEVRDSGIGVAEEDQEHIFEMFEQSESTLGRRFEGSGLGLAISRRLARLMGGDIEVWSRPAEGSTFTASLILEHAPSPAEPHADEENRLDTSESRESPGGFPAGLRALIVEDNPVNRLVTESLLEELGIRSRSVADGSSALEQIRSHTYDLVLMDLQLPGIDGLEVTRRVRSEESVDRHLPIVALTANAMPADREKCREAGLDLHLAKPIGMSDLEKALRQLRQQGLLDSSGQAQARRAPSGTS